MIKRRLEIYGNKKSSKGGAGGKASETATSAATPENIDEIGKPGLHLISGSTGAGKSNVARNMVDEWWQAHARAKTNPPPEVLVFTGAGGDPVWEGANKKYVKLYSPQNTGEFVDEINRRYDRAIRAKSGGGGGNSQTAAEGQIAHAVAAGTDGQDDSEKHRPVMAVIDDSGASELLPALMFRSPIAQAVQSHRHGDMSFIISTQRYTNHNPFLRANAATVNVFPPRGEEEKAFIRRELPIPHDAMKRGFAVATANGKHNFISVDMRERVATHNFTGHPI